MKKQKLLFSILFVLFGSISCLSTNSSISQWNRIAYDQTLEQTTVRQMVELKDGNLWFVSSDGQIYQFDISEQKWLTENTPDYDIRINTLTIDQKKNVLVGTENGIAQIIQGEWYFFPNEGLVNADIRAILKDSQKNLWVGTADAGIYKSENGGESWSFITIEEGFSNFTTYQIYEDTSKNIWIATGGALFRYDPISEEWITYTDGKTRYNTISNS